ncbi:Protein of unknown function [Bacillus cereus]|nr:Protein of unknown function [Bacillus cereus]
MKERFVEK